MLQFDIWNAFACASPELRSAVVILQSRQTCDPLSEPDLDSLEGGDPQEVSFVISRGSRGPWGRAVDFKEHLTFSSTEQINFSI